jgi:hypothetical protein
MELAKQRKARQSVGVFSYLFPSFVSSGFDLEAPLSLEEARTRLEKVSRVRTTQKVSYGDDEMTISVAPIDVGFMPMDDDTYRYRADLHHPRYRITVVGYLKRWEQVSTVLTGRVYFDLHYIGLLFKSAMYAAGAMLATIFLIVLIGVLFNAHQFYLWLVAWGIGAPWILLLWWPVIFIILWLHEVIAPAHVGRTRLVTRIEDMLLFPGMSDG